MTFLVFDDQEIYNDDRHTQYQSPHPGHYSQLTLNLIRTKHRWSPTGGHVTRTRGSLGGKSDKRWEGEAKMGGGLYVGRGRSEA